MIKSGTPSAEMIANCDAFDTQFEILTGLTPFRWQRRLFHDHLLTGKVPAALDLPTGLGKTSVMAIWYLALRVGAPVPRRLIYVVDRRAVVDQATTVADEIVNSAADAMLRVSTLRGRHVDNRAWLADPTTPAIVVGTVDMIGSRLLFSGFGVSRKMRPYHAGLLGADALVVLDEAHLVPAFEKLLETIEDGIDLFGPRAEGDRQIVPSFKVLSLSATGRARSGTVFRLCEADLRDDIVKKRLCAKKAIRLVEIGDEKLENVLASQAWELAGHGNANIRCVVYCDRRTTAESTRKKLDDLMKGAGETELFVGARRVRERETAARRLAELGFIAGSEIERAKPSFLIATSAAEVGVDLDADHMVGDLVPWERMVQRLGRVNRRGDGNAQVVVVDSGESRSKKPDEPTASELRVIISRRVLGIIDNLPKNAQGYDASPGALRDLKLRAVRDGDLRAQIDAATTPAPLRPALTRALIDAWSMTSLTHHSGRPEDINPWLRGWIDEDEPQASVIWRTYLPVRMHGQEASRQEVEDFFAAAPPHTSEVLETEVWRVVEWLLARAKAVSRRTPKHDDGASLEQAAEALSEQVTDTSSAKPLEPTDIVAFALTPAGDLRHCYRLGGLAAGEADKKLKVRLSHDLLGTTLILDARLGGLADGLLDEKEATPPRTADDGGEWLPSQTDGRPVVGFRVYRMTAPLSAKTGERGSHTFATRRTDEGEETEALVIETVATEESRATAVNPQFLAEHQCWTERKALAIAEAVGLTGDDRKALTIAARLHDEGKKSDRWQRAFNAPHHSGAYAKTKGPISIARLDGYRHEFGSLSYAERDAEFRELPPLFQDLVLHLIATHHGNARPIIEAHGCEDAPPSALEARARDVALRFARLQMRWGPWGLAWWEALLRAADQQASRDHDARGKLQAGATTIREAV